MSSGPLRQVVGAVGLLCLLPTAWLLATGALTPVQSAVRALATLLGVLIVGRIAAWWLDSVARTLEKHGDDDGNDRPRRRRTDGPAAASADATAKSDAQNTLREGSDRTGSPRDGRPVTTAAAAADPASGTP